MRKMSEQGRSVQRRLTACLFFSVFLLFGGCSGEHAGTTYLADFESDADLDRLQWSCRTFFSLSAEHVAHGTKSLKVELYPSPYPGLSFVPHVKNWKGYRALSFDIRVPSGDDVVNVRIDDRVGGDMDDREFFSRGLAVQRGTNRISIPLGGLATSDGRRNLELSRIERVHIFAVAPNKKTVWHIDAIRLE